MEIKTMGIQMPIMSPVPIPTPVGVSWWNVLQQLKVLQLRATPRKWLIEEDYYLKFPWLDEIICIPKGFIFDGASIPRPLWSFISPTGVMFIPGLFHDFGYRYQCFLTEGYKPIYIGETKEFFDYNFKKMGIYLNNATIIAPITWFALVVFGFVTWISKRIDNRSVDIDFPRIITAS
jgi:hypothetical protein